MTSRHGPTRAAEQDSVFLDSAVIRDCLYADADRLTIRTRALHEAKISGQHAAVVAADLAAAALRHVPRPVVVDVGCGRGTTTRVLAQRLRSARVIAVDVSSACLDAACRRLAETSARAQLLGADFHRLPLRQGTCDLAVAAFCLYHSPRPEAVIGEIARSLTPAGAAVLVTKSADSYRDLDDLIANTGLDPHARQRPSLYATAHSGNLAELAAQSLEVRKVLHHDHRFLFRDRDHLAAYLATTPKYRFAVDASADPQQLADLLRHHLPDRPVATTSTVTYVVAARRSARQEPSRGRR